MSKKLKNVAPERNSLGIIFEPLATLLDNQMWQTDNFGKTKPSMYAGPIIYTLGGICQNVWRQLHGNLGSVPNATDREREAFDRLSDIAAKFGDDHDSRDSNANYIRASNSWMMALATREALEECLAYCMDAYGSVTGMPWEPLPERTEPVKQLTPKNDAAVKAAAIALQTRMRS